MASLTYSSISCGVNQLYGVSRGSPENILRDMSQYMYGPYHSRKFAFVTWSDVWRPKTGGGGNKLYNYIRKHFPGSHIYRSRKSVNPNSGNKICVYYWKIPRKRFKKWAKKMGFLN